MSPNIPRVEDPPLRSVESPATDILLREDVKQLGALVGEILAEQEGADFLSQVETIRVAAIRPAAVRPAAVRVAAVRPNK